MAGNRTCEAELMGLFMEIESERCRGSTPWLTATIDEEDRNSADVPAI
jgi:hypothetical protein